jgi:LPXTG-motif cell wall-anchored protein
VSTSAQFVAPAQDPPDPPAKQASDLASTGFDAGILVALGLFAIFMGFGLLRFGRRRAARP